ncbi:MAG: TetR/AcrR family transcriptional regulator [Gammaproteobacteria bacterium]|nr:TetR/AcrR family transcriptional regulator [Gammaproteobacteria bacterium]
MLLAAEALLAESGVQGTTLRACARRAGVSHAAPKHHFNDVTELLSEVAARSFDKLTDRLASARIRAGVEPDRRYIAVARTYVLFAREFPAHFRLMFRSDLLRRDNEALVAAAAKTFSEMTNSITVQRGEADVTPEELIERITQPDLAGDIFIGWSHIHGFAQLLLEGQLDIFGATENTDEFIENALATSGTRIAKLLRSG